MPSTVMTNFHAELMMKPLIDTVKVLIGRLSGGSGVLTEVVIPFLS